MSPKEKQAVKIGGIINNWVKHALIVLKFDTTVRYDALCISPGAVEWTKSASGQIQEWRMAHKFSVFKSL